MHRIRTQADIEHGLDTLCRADPRLEHVRRHAGPIPLRLTPPGFASLVSIVVSQQVSRAAAAAILGRYEMLLGAVTPERVVSTGTGAMRDAGLSRPKQRTILALAEAVASRCLDLEGLHEAEAGAAMSALTALPGIGPWTAEVYLLFAAGHPDIFPGGDVALRAAVAHGLGFGVRPDARTLALVAESWSPWRGVAARLFWAYYASMKGREVLPPVVTSPDP